ncbi:MAG: hypothetical protein WCC11_10520 [Gammaproteobacteria bacterium]
MGGLNDSQKRYVLSVLSEVGHYLDNIEGLMHAKKMLFRDLSDDLAPTERNDLAAFIQALRAEMLGMQDAFNLEHANAAASARWGVSTNLEFASVELMELTQSKLSGYGPLDEPVFMDLKIQLDRLQQLIDLQMQKLPPVKTGGGG